MTQNNIETLELNCRGIGHPLSCGLCDIEPETVDKEWMGNGEWQETWRCPSCERETTMLFSGSVSHRDRSEQADDIATEYVESAMSEESLERSLDRVYDLDETA